MAATPRRMSEVARLSRPAAVTAKNSAENDYCDFDVKIGAHGYLDGFSEARKDIGDDQARKEGNNVSTFVVSFSDQSMPNFCCSAGETAAKFA